MPAKSEKQAKFMRAVAHSPKFAKKVGVPQSVGKEFEMAGKKVKKFGRGDRVYTAPAGQEVVIPLEPTLQERIAANRLAMRRRTAAGADARAAAERAKAEEKRYRDAMGSDDEILARAVRSQEREAREAAAARRMADDKAKGGKIVKKYAKGGVTKELPSANQMGSLNMKNGGKVKKMATGGKTRPSGTIFNPLPSSKYASGGKTRPSGTTGPYNPLPKDKYAAGGRAARVGGSGKAAPGTPTPVRPGFKKGGKPAAKAAPMADKAGRAMTKKSADTMGRAMKFAKGGGIERKGKTSTTMVKMNRGGKMKKGC